MNEWIKRRLPLCISFMTFGLVFAVFAVASAAVDVHSYANSSSGSQDTLALIQSGVGIPGFDEILRGLGTDLVRSARYIVAIMIAAAGILFAFGIEDGKKQMWGVILGIGLALNIGSLIYSAYGTYLGDGGQQQTGTIDLQVITPGEAESGLTKEQGIDEAKSKAANPKKSYTEILTPKENPNISGNDYHLFSSFINSYVKYVIQPGSHNVKSILIKLALIITAIDASIQIAMEIGNLSITSFMVKLALKLGFNIFLLENWLTGMQLTQNLCNGFEEIGLKMAGYEMQGNHLVLAGMSDGAVAAAILIVSCFLAILGGISLITMNPVPLLVGLGLALVFVVTMVWIAIEMFLAQIEFYTMALLCMMLLPFNMSKHTEFLAKNAIAAMFNCAMKVAVIAFLSSVGMVSLGKYLDDISKQFLGLSSGNFLATLLQMCITVVILGILMWRIPALVQSVLSGQPSMSVGDTINTVQNAVSKTAAVATKGASMAGRLQGAASRVADGGGGSAGGHMMSAIQNIGGGLKDMALSGFKGESMSAGVSRIIDGAVDVGKAGMTAGKVAGAFAESAAVDFAGSSAIMQAYTNSKKSGYNPHNLTEAEKSFGTTPETAGTYEDGSPHRPAVKRDRSGQAIDENGHAVNPPNETQVLTKKVDTLIKTVENLQTESGGTTGGGGQSMTQTRVQHVPNNIQPFDPNGYYG